MLAYFCSRCGVQSQRMSLASAFPPNWKMILDRLLCVACLEELEDYLRKTVQPDRNGEVEVIP